MNGPEGPAVNRRVEIRRLAYDWAARELDAATNVWEVSELLFPDEAERELFDADVAGIVSRLAARGRRHP